MAQVIVEMTGQEAQLWKAQQKIIAQQLKLEEGYRKVATASNKSTTSTTKEANQSSDAMGGMIKKAGALAAGFLSIERAVSAALQTLDKLNKVGKDAAAFNDLTRVTTGSFAQLSNTKEQFDEFKSIAERVHTILGKDKTAADALVFQLASAGQVEHAELIARLGLIENDPVGLATASTTFQSALGTKETGDLKQIISKAFIASAESPTSVGDLIMNAAKGAAAAGLLKISDEELLASTTIASKGMGSAAEGVTTVRSFLKSIGEKEEFAGTTIADAVDKIGAMNLSTSGAIEFFGRQEALSGFHLLYQDREKLRKLTADIQAGNEHDVVEKKLSFAENDEIIGASLNRSQVKSQTEIINQSAGAVTSWADAIVEESVTRSKAELESMLGERLGGFVAEMKRSMIERQRRIKGDDAFLRSVTDPVESAMEVGAVQQEKRNDIRDVLRLRTTSRAKTVSEQLALVETGGVKNEDFKRRSAELFDKEMMKDYERHFDAEMHIQTVAQAQANSSFLRAFNAFRGFFGADTKRYNQLRKKFGNENLAPKEATPIDRLTAEKLAIDRALKETEGQRGERFELLKAAHLPYFQQVVDKERSERGLKKLYDTPELSNRRPGRLIGNSPFANPEFREEILSAELAAREAERKANTSLNDEQRQKVVEQQLIRQRQEGELMVMMKLIDLLEQRARPNDQRFGPAPPPSQRANALAERNAQRE